MDGTALATEEESAETDADADVEVRKSEENLPVEAEFLARPDSQTGDNAELASVTATATDCECAQSGNASEDASAAQSTENSEHRAGASVVDACAQSAVAETHLETPSQPVSPSKAASTAPTRAPSPAPPNPTQGPPPGKKLMFVCQCGSRKCRKYIYV